METGFRSVGKRLSLPIAANDADLAAVSFPHNGELGTENFPE